MIKKHIPNLITSGNAACGAIGIIFIFQDNLMMATIMVWSAAILDFFDGFAARLVGVSSELGKQLDSLADMISFGALPGFFLYQMILPETKVYWLPYLGILIVVFSALRLAKFNIDPRQSDVFYGLPTPANALFITGLPYLADIQLFSWIAGLESLLVIAVLFSLLMVADIPLLSLKFKNFKFQDNWERFLLVTMSVILLLVWNFKAISLVILAYLLLSIVVNLLRPKSVNNK